MTDLQDELARVDCKGKLKRWRRPVAKGSEFYHWLWKCPCGKGMRYASMDAMYNGANKHKKECGELNESTEG